MRLDSYKTYIAPRLAQLRQRLRRPSRRNVLLALAALPALLLLYLLLLIPFTPGISDIRKAKSEQPAQVLSADGKELAVYRWANRDWVKLADISPNVVNALIATEDHRFYQHFGLDWRRTASAALHTFSGDRQGGSTITQQLARNRYPDEIGRAPTLTRKLKEAITALKIEALYSKDEILETYLNTVPFLYNAFGIEMAARTYFDKSARQLDVLEAATLIGMLKGNSYYNPVLNPQRALERRNIVLAQMVKRGKLDAARYEVLARRPLRIDFERQVEEPGPAAHFAQQLRKWLISWADSNDYNLYTDGLVIHTTIDARLQAMANQALARQANQLQSIANAAWAPRAGWAESRGLVQQFVRETPEYRAAVAGGQTDADALNHLMRDNAFMQNLRQNKTRVQAGFMALDPATGEIRAWVGSRDFTVDAFDHVAQARRQPGSTFKPFVYGAAFARGQSPDETFIDQPVEIKLAGGEIWRPTDETAPTGRAMSLRDGLVYSKNTITAQLVQNLGPDRVARLARAMGVRDSKLEEVPSLALGTSPVTLKEMVSAYGTIANGGQYLAPSMITRITDRDGKELARFRPASPERALSATANETLLDVMRDVVDRGTGTAIRTRYGIRADVAGKTGTTQDNADGWFILMHPQLVAGAWVGFNDSRVTLRSDYWGQGAHSALPIVGDFYQRALRARIVDARARFAEVDEKTWYSGLTDTVRGWYQKLFASDRKDDSAPLPRPAPRRPVLPATDADAMPPASAPATAASADNGLALDPGEVVEAVPPGGHEMAASSEPSAAPPIPTPAPTPAPSSTAAPASAPAAL